MRVWVPRGRGAAAAIDVAGIEVEPFPLEDPGADPSGVKAVVPFWEPPRRELDRLGELPDLRLVQSVSAGVGWLRPFVPDRVTLCSGSGIHDVAVSEWVLATVLAMQRRVPGFVVAQRRGTWSPEDGRDLHGRTVLLLGHGSIGAAVEERLAPFGVDLLRVARSARDGVHPVDELPRLLPAVDVLVSLLPGTPATRQLLDAEALARLPDDALVVNAGRGTAIDTDALLAELTSGRLRAALDVTDPEPLPEGHPLWDAPGLLLTPHVGGDTDGFWGRAWSFVAGQLVRLRDGEPLHNVVGDAGY